MELYRKPAGVETRWASYENPTAGRGSGGQTNRGAKGYAFDHLPAGATVDLLNIAGSGLITRIWLTVRDRSPQMLRALRIEMTWDGANTPAVSVPLGDFFGIGLGRRTPFENALFADPEGRSFNCFIPMPFRERARITLTNDSDTDLSHLFYDVDLLLGVSHPDDMLYFHAHWRRESPNTLGEDYLILPPVSGSGRFLGCNLGIMADPAYETSWWGEGEVKAWLDGDDPWPTLCGTGTEDYIGTAWGQGAYVNRTQGCPIADRESRQWCFYRYHVDDPIYFDHDCRVAIQTIGGSSKEHVMALQEQGAALVPVSINTPMGQFLRLMEQPQPVDLGAQPEGWCNYFRQDDWSSTAYFYLDQPENGLDPLPAADIRSAGLLFDPAASARADT